MSGRLSGLLRGRETAAALLLLAVFVLLQIGSNRHKSIMIEEPNHYTCGWHLLHFNSPRFTDAVMLFSMLNALPRMLVSGLQPGPRCGPGWRPSSSAGT